MMVYGLLLKKWVQILFFSLCYYSQCQVTSEKRIVRPKSVYLCLRAHYRPQCLPTFYSNCTISMHNVICINFRSTCQYTFIWKYRYLNQNCIVSINMQYKQTVVYLRASFQTIVLGNLKCTNVKKIILELSFFSKRIAPRLSIDI